jgi:hypothetical protein
VSTPYVRVCIGPILSLKERVHIEHIAHTEYIYVPWYFPYTVTARLVLHRRPQAAGCRLQGHLRTERKKAVEGRDVLTK